MPLLQIFAAEEQRSYGGLLAAVFGIKNQSTARTANAWNSGAKEPSIPLTGAVKMSTVLLHGMILRHVDRHCVQSDHHEWQGPALQASHVDDPIKHQKHQTCPSGGCHP